MLRELYNKKDKGVVYVEYMHNNAFFIGGNGMNRKNQESTLLVDFKDVTPEVRMDREEPTPLYKEAFLSGEEKSTSEFSRNTTTWD